MKIRQNTVIETAMEQLIGNGAEDMGPIFARLFDLAMRIERERFPGVGHYERNTDRRGYVNGRRFTPCPPK